MMFDHSRVAEVRLPDVVRNAWTFEDRILAKTFQFDSSTCRGFSHTVWNLSFLVFLDDSDRDVLSCVEEDREDCVIFCFGVLESHYTGSSNDSPVVHIYRQPLPTGDIVPVYASGVPLRVAP